MRGFRRRGWWRAFVLSVLAWGSPVVATAQSINPATVHVVNSPNALLWPVTTTITSVEARQDGILLSFDKCERWPDVTPPGWAGPLRFTVWLFLNIGGEWYASGVVQAWSCDRGWGGPIWQDQQIARNWVYDSRWSAMVQHQPAPGERIGFMVSAGNARGQNDHLVAERSNIVEVAMPQGAGPIPVLAAEGVPVATPPAPLTPVVVPPVVPVPVPTPVPIPPVYPPVMGGTEGILLAVQTLQAQVLALRADLAAVSAALAAHDANDRQWQAEVKSVWQQLGAPLLKYVAPAVAALYVGKKMS